jgi:hypothetical protein
MGYLIPGPNNRVPFKIPNHRCYRPYRASHNIISHHCTYIGPLWHFGARIVPIGVFNIFITRAPRWRVVGAELWDFGRVSTTMCDIRTKNGYFAPLFSSEQLHVECLSTMPKMVSNASRAIIRSRCTCSKIMTDSNRNLGPRKVKCNACTKNGYMYFAPQYPSGQLNLECLSTCPKWCRTPLER